MNPYLFGASQVALVVKEPTCHCRRRKRRGFSPWVGKIPWRRKWTLQYSCLESPMDRGAWRAIVHGVKKSRTWPLSTPLPSYSFTFTSCLCWDIEDFKGISGIVAVMTIWFLLNVLLILGNLTVWGCKGEFPVAGNMLETLGKMLSVCRLEQFYSNTVE